MRVSILNISALIALRCCGVYSFHIPHSTQWKNRVPSSRVEDPLTRLHSTTEQEEAVIAIAPNAASKRSSSSSGKASLGLLTFDLDDTIYPLAPVIQEANAAFARAMERYGFPNIQPNDITLRSVEMRKAMAATDPERAATLSHTEIRKLAIRKEMELVMFERKLKECAVDWATNVESLGPAVVASARQYVLLYIPMESFAVFYEYTHSSLFSPPSLLYRWSSKAVSSSVVEAVLTAWEMERHHAAERHLYVEVLPVLKQIKQEHPGVIIGAVTDGKANPKFMTFTLANYFDFCINWEDDQGGRRKFFQELSKVEGNAELTWIYNATFEKGRELSEAAAAIRNAKKSDDGTAADEDAFSALPIVGQANSIWIHVGDDLAYDVGGSAQCGAKTVLAELADKYGQTARHRFDAAAVQPEWSVASEEELSARAVMNEAAVEFVNERLEYWHLLPDVINKILDDSSAV